MIEPAIISVYVWTPRAILDAAISIGTIKIGISFLLGDIRNIEVKATKPVTACPDGNAPSQMPEGQYSLHISIPGSQGMQGLSIGRAIFRPRVSNRERERAGIRIINQNLSPLLVFLEALSRIIKYISRRIKDKYAQNWGSPKYVIQYQIFSNIIMICF